MNDNDIIKALEHCVSSTTSEACNGCPFFGTTICTEMENGLQIYALDLINRQKVEIERLQKYNTDMARKHYNDGIKEFTEKTDKIITEIYNKFIFGDYDLGDEAREAIMDFCVDISHAINNLV